MKIYISSLLLSISTVLCNLPKNCGDALTNISCDTSDTSCYVASIYVPRQLSYNPLFENGLLLNKKISENWEFIFSAKPIYQKSTGCKFKRYFSINHQDVMSVQENGSGDISSLWFKVVGQSTSPKLYYSSNLSLCPEAKKYGSMFYAALHLPCSWQLTFNTAFIAASNNVNLIEAQIQNSGTLKNLPTISSSFVNSNRSYGKICRTSKQKIGLDDIQIKIIKEFCHRPCFYWDAYVLFGIPTGKGTKAKYLFEPLVGSKHAQFGLGTDFEYIAREYKCGSIALLGELKWRYGIKGNEYRSFDLTNNGNWSRYMLFVQQSNHYADSFAINNLTFLTSVTPRNSLDVYLAMHWNLKKWNFELGYDFWYRSQEKIELSIPGLGNRAIADLVGISEVHPVSASKANISQGELPGSNQMVSDSVYTPVTPEDINLNSGAQPKNKSNSIYGSIGYAAEYNCHPVEVGVSASYERGSGINSPDFFSTWFNIDFYF